MDIKINDLFKTLNVSEVSGLLEKDITFQVENKAVARVKVLTFQKIKGNRKQSFASKFKNLRVAAVAACMIMALGGSASYGYYQAPIAYLDIDINPSIELGINRWDRIVSAKAYNSDGEGVLKAKKILNKSAEEGVKAIMEIANEQGFLDQEEGAAVAITSITDDTDKAQALTKLSKEIAEEYIAAEALNVEIIIEHIALKRLEEAKELGITPGKLNLIQNLQVLDDTITVEAYKDLTVKEIMKTAIALKKEQKVNQKEKKLQMLEENSDSEENKDEELLEINEDNSEGKLDIEDKKNKKNTKVLNKENKINGNSGNKPISPQDMKQNTEPDQEQGKKANDKPAPEADNKAGTKPESKQVNNQDAEQKNNQSNKQNSGQEKTDNTKQSKK